MLPLPPLDHLRAFEAAARHLSFKEAANELSVTPAAIGQRIRALESHLKLSLFTRMTRKVVLTNDGEELMSAVSTGLSTIRQGLTRIQARQHTNTLTISTTNSFTERCLLPRLPEFSTLYPDCDVRIIATDERVDFINDNVDLAIRFGRGDYQNSHSVRLIDDNYIPVCAPDLLPGAKIQSPEDLYGYVLINTDWQVERAAMPTWDKWFEMYGFHSPATVRWLTVSIEAHAIRAATNRQGIALAHQLFVEQDLREGRLIQVLDHSFSLKSEFSHYLVWPDSAKSDLADKFREWAITAFGKNDNA